MNNEQSAINWAILLHIQTEGWEAPPIDPNLLPAGISTLNAIYSIMGNEFNIPTIWTPPSIEELKNGAQKYWAHRKEYAVFDKSATLNTICQSLSQNRALNYTELVLVLKCDLFAKCRNYALTNNFNLIDNVQRCENQCICHFIVDA
jgi:hypothetical protein